ncbi:zinc-ribbon domain-containing protein [Desulfosarcina sp. OttesenSCG-928-G10]|nr:zinc-ribbon domain-containing protein [Desulfosarcina sp. OttesenSCG-928-G10]MDL2321161.1 zinc-ribbon domain-containing protein [Desulfosarcina sp. OttesenSCG-928-B08]
MDVVCGNCQGRFKVPDEKFPKNKIALLTCPKCSHRITVAPVTIAPQDRPPSFPSAEKEENLFFTDDDRSDAGYEDAERPFDFIFMEEGKVALLCESDPITRQTIAQVLYLLEYQVTEVNTTKDALNGMRYQTYDLIVVNELFDAPAPETNGVLMYLARLNMAVRRNMLVVLLTHRFRTMDPMVAFEKSVNTVINLDHLSDFGKIIRNEMSQLASSYQHYKESLLNKA